MDISIQRQRKFAAELSRQEPEDRRRIEAAIAKLTASAAGDRGALTKELRHTQRVRLPDKLDSTLHVARVGRNLRMLFALDDDPLFHRTVVTLLRLVKPEDVDQAFRQAAKTLYVDFDYVIEETNGSPRKATG